MTKRLSYRLGDFRDEAGRAVDLHEQHMMEEVIRRWNLVAEWDERKATAHVDGKWCTDLMCRKCYSADTAKAASSAPPPCRCAEVARLVYDSMDRITPGLRADIMARLLEIGENRE